MNEQQQTIIVHPIVEAINALQAAIAQCLQQANWPLTTRQIMERLPYPIERTTTAEVYLILEEWAAHKKIKAIHIAGCHPCYERVKSLDDICQEELARELDTMHGKEKWLELEYADLPEKLIAVGKLTGIEPAQLLRVCIAVTGKRYQSMSWRQILEMLETFYQQKRNDDDETGRV